MTTPPTDAPEHLATDLEFGGTPVLAALLPSVPATSAPIPARPASVEPLAPERYKVQFTASAETHEKLRQAQALLRHQIPDGDVGAILDRALTALLEQLMKQKVAATNRPRGSATTKPRESSPTPDSRHIPADVRRVVWQRDGGQCAFVSRTGRRCTERGFLEFHHVKPYSAGGEASVQNIELRCRAHNGYAAERAFGQKTSAVRERAEAYVTSERGLADTGSFELGPDRVHLAQPGHVTSAGASRVRVPSGMEQADHFTLAAIFGVVGRIRRYSGSEARSRGRPQGDR